MMPVGAPQEAAAPRFLAVRGVRVDERILTTPYTCDPALYGCLSECCFRGCIVNQAEIERIRAHLPEIAPFLSPTKRKALADNGSFVADCPRQCPGGCEIHDLEWEAVRLHLAQGESPRCLPYARQMCFFAYRRKGRRLCAIHSFALEAGIPLTGVKPLDCVQYPLYLGEDDHGRFLSVQETPHLSHIPCMRDPRGEPMVLSLGYAIEALLGKEFYRELLQAFQGFEPHVLCRAATQP